MRSVGFEVGVAAPSALVDPPAPPQSRDSMAYVICAQGSCRVPIQFKNAAVRTANHVEELVAVT